MDTYINKEDENFTMNITNIHHEIMNESDIKDVLNLLKMAIRNEDWDYVHDSVEYLQDFLLVNVDIEEE
jgi:hypothetical protein